MHTEIGHVAIINSGNRTAIVTRLILAYMQPAPRRQPSCDYDTGSYFETDFKPTVIKPGDAVVSNFKATEPAKFISTNPTVQVTDTKDFLLPLAEHNKGAKDVLLDICLFISLSTPSSDFHTRFFPIERFHASDPIGNYYDPDTEGSINKLPVTLIKRTGIILGD